jgi:hypothetical protein
MAFLSLCRFRRLLGDAARSALTFAPGRSHAGLSAGAWRRHVKAAGVALACAISVMPGFNSDALAQGADPDRTFLVPSSADVPEIPRKPPPEPEPEPPVERVLPTPLPPIEDGGDDWSVLTAAEIEAAIATMGEPLELVAPRRVWLRWMVALGGVGVGLLVLLAARLLFFRIRTGRTALRMHWAWWLPILPFLLLLPRTLPFFVQETAIELRTWKYYLSGRPIPLQGTMRHTQTGEPIAGVWVRYPLRRWARYYAGETGCVVDLILRTDAEGRWRAELPPRIFARYMAEYGAVDPSPWLYARGMRDDWGSKFTPEESDRMAMLLDTGPSQRRRRAEKGDFGALMVEDERDVAARLQAPGGRSGACDDRYYPIAVVGPREAMMRSVLREQRELRCAGTADGSPWPRSALQLSGLPHAGRGREEEQRFSSFVRGLDRETHEFDFAVCQYLQALDP